MKRLPFVALALGGWWFAVGRRWQGPLYCIEQPGTFWNGLTPDCPQSRSHRREVRRESSVEKSASPARWQPKALMDSLKVVGFAMLTDAPIAPGNYASFLSRGTVMLHDLATLEGSTTLITLSGCQQERLFHFARITLRGQHLPKRRTP